MRISVTVAGIPALVDVLHYHNQEPFKGSARHCDSDQDFYGYSELDYVLLDRKGYRARWLEKKVKDLGLEDELYDTILETIGEQYA
jgi:hypothetical protein